MERDGLAVIGNHLHEGLELICYGHVLYLMRMDSSYIKLNISDGGSVQRIVVCKDVVIAFFFPVICALGGWILCIGNQKFSNRVAISVLEQVPGYGYGYIPCLIWCISGKAVVYPDSDTLLAVVRGS